MTPRRRAHALLGALCVIALLVACSPDRAAYDAAVARMDALDGRVDAAFDAAREVHAQLFAKDAWDDPGALAERLKEAEGHIDEAIADQDRRIATEEEILGLKAMKDAADTRLLYHLDLDAQRAKRDVFALMKGMYGDLIQAVLDRDPGAYAKAADAHGARIDAANARYRELDLDRQRRQNPAPGP